MGSSKSVYTWTTVDFPTGGTLTQEAEIPNLPTKGKIIRVRFATAAGGTGIRYWISETPFDDVTTIPPLPEGGVLSMVTELALVTTDPVDNVGEGLRDSNGAALGANRGVPFELTETGPPGSKQGSLFLGWRMAVAGPVTFQLVIEPLVT